MIGASTTTVVSKLNLNACPEVKISKFSRKLSSNLLSSPKNINEESKTNDDNSCSLASSVSYVLEKPSHEAKELSQKQNQDFEKLQSNPETTDGPALKKAKTEKLDAYVQN